MAADNASQNITLPINRLNMFLLIQIAYCWFDRLPLNFNRWKTNYIFFHH